MFGRERLTDECISFLNSMSTTVKQTFKTHLCVSIEAVLFKKRRSFILIHPQILLKIERVRLCENLLQ